MSRPKPSYYAEAVRLREQGVPSAEIAARLGVSTASIVQGVRKAGWKGFQKRCALEECRKEFWTGSVAGKFCCRLHSKRHAARAAGGTIGLHTQEIECALPECKKTFRQRGTAVLYCCKRHGDLHNRRMERSTFFYARVLHRVKQKCLVCDERYVLDEHHIEFRGTKSNKQSKTVWLCPTHHMAIHRGFARFDGERYVFTVEDIREGLHRKHPSLVEGKDWSAK